MCTHIRTQLNQLKGKNDVLVNCCVCSSEKRIHSTERVCVCECVRGEIKGFTIDTLRVQSHAMCIYVSPVYIELEAK